MKNNIMTIIKKECSRLFSDKTLFFTAVIMPGVFIFAVYTLMGSLIENLYDVGEEYSYQVHAVNMPASISGVLAEMDLSADIIETPEADIEAVKTRIENQETDLLIVFPVNFDALVDAFDINTATEAAPNIQIWSNMARTESAAANNLISSAIYSYHTSLSHKFTINAATEEGEQYDLASEADMFASYFAFMLPLILMIFIFTSCQSLAPESISGEKERGTLGTVLVTPAKRSDLAIGKIISITFFAILGTIGSFIGLIASLPQMMQMDDINFYSAGDYALVLVVLATTALVFVSILSILSANAKSVKEATASSMPVMVLSMACGLSSLVMGGAPDEFYWYLIPLFNSAQCITAIFAFEVSAVNIAVTAASNVAFMLICSFILAKMFNSEKIVFDK